MKLLYPILFVLFISSLFFYKDANETKNAKEWISLFNGENLNNWVVKIQGHPVGEDPRNTFRVENNLLKVSYDQYENFNNAFGHLFYKQPFSSYILRLQYRFVGDQMAGGEAWADKNSGVMIYAQSPDSMQLDQSFPVSIEVQLLGGLDSKDQRPTANLCTPGTHVTINKQLVTDHCIFSGSETFYDEQWIDLEIKVIKGNSIRHKINGKEVLRYASPQIGGDYNTLKSKEGQLLESGYIALQSESHPVEFRNIELMVLDIE